jgi:hypothetical protein
MGRGFFARRLGVRRHPHTCSYGPTSQAVIFANLLFSHRFKLLSLTRAGGGDVRKCVIGSNSP